MFQSKKSLQEHTNKYIQNNGSNRYAIEPPFSHNDVEAQASISQFHHNSTHIPNIPHTFTHAQFSKQTSLEPLSHEFSSSSQRTQIEPNSPEHSSLCGQTFAEPTLDHKNDELDENEINEMKLLFEVEIKDDKGNIIRRKKMAAKDVNKLNEGKQVLVPINGYNQPLKRAGGLCTRYMTLLLKQPNLCPLDAKDWKEVKMLYGARLIGELRRKFCLTQGECVDKVLLKIFGDKYRALKFRRKERLFKLAKKKLNEANNIGGNGAQAIEYTEDQILDALDLVEIPSNFQYHQWERYKHHLRSDEAKGLSQLGKKARAEQIHAHATGAVSYARKKDEFQLKNKREAGQIEFFDIVHLTKKGTYVNTASRDFMELAKKEVSKKIVDLGSSEPIDFEKQSTIERDVMTELMGPDMPGRARLHGTGVTKSQVTPLSLELRKMRGENFSNQNQVSTLLVQVESQSKKIESQNMKIESQNLKIESQNKQIEGMQQAMCDFRGELRIFQSVFQNSYGSSTSRDKYFSGPSFSRDDMYNTQLPLGYHEDS